MHISFIWPKQYGFEDSNFGLQFTRVTLVDLFGDEGIGKNYTKKQLRSQWIIMKHNEMNCNIMHCNVMNFNEILF